MGSNFKANKLKFLGLRECIYAKKPIFFEINIRKGLGSQNVACCVLFFTIIMSISDLKRLKPDTGGNP